MLAEARLLQQNAVNQLVQLAETEQELFVFRAPTGSGKTFMMADFMNRMLSKMECSYNLSLCLQGILPASSDSVRCPIG